MNTLANFCTKLVSKWLPDPLVIAIFLTFVSAALAFLFGEGSALDIVDSWGSGFWNLLEFTMQMTVILLAGYMLALTPLVDKLLDWLTQHVNKPRTAIIMITLAAGIGSWLNWGFGLVAGGIIAKKTALHVKGLHYPLAIAAGFSGFSVYGIGLSGSVPLLISTPGHFLEEKMGIVPISETIFSPWLLAASVGVIVLLPLFNAMMHPKEPALITEIRFTKETHPSSDLQAEPLDRKITFGDRMNNSPVWGITIGLLGITYTLYWFVNGGSLNLNTVNFIFVMLGLMLFARPKAYLTALQNAVTTVSGIIIQYPFYAGIMAILVGSGLIVTFSDLFGNISTAATLPLWAFLSAGIINILVPSGGGQFAVQGPVMVEAAQHLGADITATAIAVQIGDQWTNMIQPFWIIPVLAISGLKLRDVMGYMVMIFMFLGVIFGGIVITWGLTTS